ncbi:hypothetical protein [Acidiplasma cupricumulans]|uniref:hypothetical protein n=1 Tax=Acidiplasma cupricumulans TaxID=312540 RepID=UPI00078232C3|nr:hypothetical protein [Acidiplasma cupricumulans]
MKPEIIKRQGLRKVCKLAERSEGEKKEIFSAAIKLFRMFDDIECIKIYNEDNDVIFKVRLADNDYRYVKIVFVNNDSFDLINLDFSQRRIGRTNLFNEIIKSIQQSQSIDRQTRIEILNYIDFKKEQKN